MSRNSINVIKPYRWEGLWVFDDPRVELVREPFVGGADRLIDMATARKGIQDPDDGFLLLFSASPFPDADFQLRWVRQEMGGNVYVWDEAQQEGWLCPALLKYFDEPPANLHIQLKDR